MLVRSLRRVFEAGVEHPEGTMWELLTIERGEKLARLGLVEIVDHDFVTPQMPDTPVREETADTPEVVVEEKAQPRRWNKALRRSKNK